MARHTTANVRERGKDITLQQHETDSPVLPVAQIEQLHHFRPDRVDWIFDQTQIEAEHRRSENRRINTYTFIERILGMVFALTIGLAGILGGLYAAIQGHDWLGGVVATVTVGTLAVGFLKGRRVQ
jgi:hypothetical protein